MEPQVGFIGSIGERNYGLGCAAFSPEAFGGFEVSAFTGLGLKSEEVLGILVDFGKVDAPNRL